MIGKCVTLLTKLRLNRLKELPLDGSFEEAMDYLSRKHPYIDIDFTADNKIDRESKFDLQVIMPAYNVEKYIAKSIESVINQKTKYRYVLTIINDGSIDGTWQIVERYKDYDNIILIDQQNKGAASARNRALEKMLGKYIMFVDADDCLCKDAIEKLLDRAFLLDADIVEGSIYSFYKGGYRRKTGIHRDSGNEIENQLWGYPFAKVIRAEVFEKIKFPERYYFEDSIFSYCIYPNYSKKYTISDFVYMYRKNPSGASLGNNGKIKTIDTYWMIGYMWKCFGRELSSDIEFQKKALRHMVLCFNRTKKLGDGITEAGFLYLSELYLKMFKTKNIMGGKYGEMDRCVRKKQYKAYRLLCRWWRFIE